MREREGEGEEAKEWVADALEKLGKAISELKREDAWEKERVSRDEDRLIELVKVYCTLLKHTGLLLMMIMKFMEESKRR